MATITATLKKSNQLLMLSNSCVQIIPPNQYSSPQCLRCISAADPNSVHHTQTTKHHTVQVQIFQCISIIQDIQQCIN